MVHKLPKPSVKARVKEKWGETFTLNPFTHSVLNGSGEEVNTKVQNRLMRARVRTRERWRMYMGEKALLHIDALPVFPKIVVVFRGKVAGFPTLCDDDAKIQLVQRFLRPRTASVPMSDETFLMA